MIIMAVIMFMLQIILEIKNENSLLRRLLSEVQIVKDGENRYLKNHEIVESMLESRKIESMRKSRQL